MVFGVAITPDQADGRKIFLFPIPIPDCQSTSCVRFLIFLLAREMLGRSVLNNKSRLKDNVRLERQVVELNHHFGRDGSIQTCFVRQ